MPFIEQDGVAYEYDLEFEVDLSTNYHGVEAQNVELDEVMDPFTAAERWSPLDFDEILRQQGAAPGDEYDDCSEEVQRKVIAYIESLIRTDEVAEEIEENYDYDY